MTTTSRRAPRRSALLALAGSVAVAVSLTAASSAIAQPAPRVAPAVQRLLDAEYLTPAERMALRIRFGIATADDCSLVEVRARVALQRGAYDDRALTADNPVAAIDPLDRADALLNRGRLADSLKLLDGRDDMRAVRLRAAALEQLNRIDEARAAIAPAISFLNAGKFTDAAEVVHAARAATTGLRLADRANRAENLIADDYQFVMRCLAKAREIDPLSWEARVAEAEALFDKDNFAQASEALAEALALNPNAADALHLMGQLAVAGFDMPMVNRLADALDALTLIPGDAIPTPPIPPAPGAATDKPATSGRSPLAASIRARAALRQNDPAGAFDALSAPLKAMPDRRDLLELRCAAISLTYDTAALDAALKDYADRSTDSPRALYWAGKALSEARQYGMASDRLTQARDLAPWWSAPVTELGLLHMQSGRDDDAMTNLRAAAAKDPFNVRVANSLKLMTELRTYERAESARFIVRSKPGLDAMLAREMLPVLEEMADIVTGDRVGGLRHTPAQKTVIDLMPDHAWFAVRIAGLPRIHTIAASTGPVIAMESPRDGPGHTGTYDWQRVLRHEYTHTVGLSRTGNRIPHWFTEAQAVYLELAPRSDRTIDLLTRVVFDDDLFDLDGINIAFTRPRKPSDRAQAYAQGHWMLEFIITTFGPDAPIRLMDLYAKGVREAEAFQTVLNVSREDFMKRFEDWAGAQLVVWGQDIPRGTPTIEKLLDAERARIAAEQNKKPEEIDEVKPNAALIDRWLTDHPAHPDLLDLAVRLRLQDTNNEPTAELIPLLNRLAKARPMDPLSHRMLIRLALASASPLTPDDAIEHLEYLDIREEKVSTYAAQLASLYIRRGDLDTAWRKAQRATRVGPYIASNRELAAKVAIMRKDFAAAKQHLEFLAALEPSQPLHKQRLDALEKLRLSQAPAN